MNHRCRSTAAAWVQPLLVLALLSTAPALRAATRQTGNAAATFLAENAMTATSAAAISARCDAAMAIIGRERAALEARTGRATIRRDFQAYDTLTLVLGDAQNEMALILQVSPIKEVRDAATACVPRLADLGTQVSLSRPIDDRLSAIPTRGLDRPTAYMLQKQLTAYRLAGVDKDKATRDRVRDLLKQITDTGLAFDSNIRDDRDDIALAPQAQ